MNRRLILIGVGVVLAVAVVLAIKLRGSDSSAAARTRDPAPTERSGTTTAGRPDPGTPDQPKLPDPTVADAVTESVIDGVRVRDHRNNQGAPYKLPANVHHTKANKLPTPVVYDVAAKLQAVIKECAQVAQEARGTKPRIEGTLFVDAKAGSLEIKEATVQLADVEGDTSAIKQCFEQKSVGQKVGASDVEDLAHYPITIVLNLPPP